MGRALGLGGTTTVVATGSPGTPTDIGSPGPSSGAADPAGVGAGPYDRAELVPEMVLHAEQLALSTRRVPAERVRFVRRIITETRMVPVEIRREVLDVERTSIGPSDLPDVSDTATTVPVAPVVVVLHEEVPLFTLEVRTVERVTATVTEVAGQTAVRAEVSSEQIEVVNVPPPAPQV